MGILRTALALGLELSGLIIGSAIISPVIAEKTGWDQSMVLAFLVILSLLLWLIHVVIFFNGKYKDS